MIPFHNTFLRFIAGLFLSLFILVGCKEEKIEPTEVKKDNIITHTSRLISNDCNGDICKGTRNINGNYLGYKMFHPNNFSGNKLPLIIVIHGGGFTEGDYRKEFDNALNFNNYGMDKNILRQNNIALVFIEYRKLNPLTGVINSLNDCKKWVEYFRMHGESFGIDPNKIVLFGSSAGASTALWIGLNHQMPYIKGLVCNIPQSSLNVDLWPGLFYKYGQGHIYNRYKDSPVITSSYPFLYDNQSATSYSNRHNLNYYNNIDSSDPELLLFASVQPAEEDLLHNFVHIYELHSKAKKRGLASKISYLPGFPSIKEGIIPFLKGKCRSSFHFQ